MGKRFVSITTRDGDGGRTRDGRGEEALKSGQRFELLGDLDELQGMLGVARATTADRATAGLIKELQRGLLQVSGLVAGVQACWDAVGEDEVDQLTKSCRNLEGQMKTPEEFVLPGANPTSAHLDMARAIARRCERRVVSLTEKGTLENEHLLAWMNRLSDYIWLLARFEAAGMRFSQKLYPLNIRR